MRPRTTRPRQILIGLTICGALGLAACGSDDGGDGGGDGDGGGASTEAFCDEMNTFAESDNGSAQEDILAGLSAIADAAPDEISDDMDTMVTLFEQLAAIDPETASEEELVDSQDLVAELETASTNVEEFAKENCPDLPADFFGEE